MHADLVALAGEHRCQSVGDAKECIAHQPRGPKRVRPNVFSLDQLANASTVLQLCQARLEVLVACLGLSEGCRLASRRATARLEGKAALASGGRELSTRYWSALRRPTIGDILPRGVGRRRQFELGAGWVDAPSSRVHDARDRLPARASLRSGVAELEARWTREPDREHALSCQVDNVRRCPALQRGEPAAREQTNGRRRGVLFAHRGVRRPVIDREIGRSVIPEPTTLESCRGTNTRGVKSWPEEATRGSGRHDWPIGECWITSGSPLARELARVVIQTKRLNLLAFSTSGSPGSLWITTCSSRAPGSAWVLRRGDPWRSRAKLSRKSLSRRSVAGSPPPVEVVIQW